MITRIQKIILQQTIEDDLYKKLKAGHLGVEVITKYPNQSIEELAMILTKGLMASWVGGKINELDKIAEGEDGMVGYGAICEAAFKGAMLRLLKEAKGLN